MVRFAGVIGSSQGDPVYSSDHARRVSTVGPLERGLIKATNSGENLEGWVVGFYGEWSDTLAKLPEKLADAQVVRWQSRYGIFD